MVRSRNTIATPPGATIKEQLNDRNMSQKEFALRMDMSEKHISKLINGEVRLTPEVAIRLEMVLGVPAVFWNNLESIYRDKLKRVSLENAMDEDICLLKKFPYNEMAKNGWVPKTAKKVDRVLNLRKFFEVIRLGLVGKPQITQIACRKLSDTEKADYALFAWAQEAKIEARRIETQAINIEKLKKILPSIRKMTRVKPEEFCEELVQVLAECGIAIVFLPHIGGSFLHGATFYDGNKIVMGLTVRGRDADRFWFSLFHEIGHIILGHLGNQDCLIGEPEVEANDFAKEILIPSKDFEAFVENCELSRESIIKFASEIDIAAGIVVGRLQKERYIDFNRYNDLKERYKIV